MRSSLDRFRIPHVDTKDRYKIALGVGVMANQSPVDHDGHTNDDLQGLCNIAQIILRAAEDHPNAGILYAAEEPSGTSFLQRYPELVDQACRILGGLRAQGLVPGRKVALLLERPQDFIPTFWACALSGFVPCPLVPIRSDQNRWAAQLAHVDELLDGPLLVTVSSLREELPKVPGLAVVSLEDLPAEEPGPITHHADPRDVALLVLTSGSTGNSKAVMLTHANLLTSMAGKAERQQLTARDVTMNWISFDHVAALLECHLFPLFVGATQVHVEPQVVLGDPVNFLRLVDRHRVSMTFTPNFLLGHLNKEVARTKDDLALDLSTLRHIVSGGEATVCATACAFLDLFAPFGLSRAVLWPAFGMTETCAGSVYSREFPDADSGAEFASLGLPVQGLALRIVDDNDTPVPAGGTGELQLRGSMIFTGYLNNGQATAAAFTADGWFRSGDLGKLDEAGRLTLVGRSKDSIIVDGVNYFSHDLETALEQLDGVNRSYVAAFPTREPGSDTEQLVVTFVPSFSPWNESELHRLLIAIRNSVVLRWGFRPALILPLTKAAMPKTSLGKIQRSLLRKRLEAGEFAEAQRWIDELTTRQLGGHTAPDGEVETALAEIYGEMFEVAPESVSATASFFELGGTSLDILRLKRKVEQRLGVDELPIMWVLLAPTVRELAARLTAGDTAGTEGYDPVVPLQLTGDKTPLFCVHPGVGEVLVFVNLAKYFVHERPIYALRARGFGAGEPYFEDFDEMVQCYVRAIRAKQPHGPYAVSGYSYGGAVAFEIAKVLESRGERVDFVGVFNLPPHIKYRMEELDFVEGAVNLALFLSLITKQQAEELPGKLRDSLPGKRHQLEALMDVSSKERLAELDLDLPKFTAWADLTQSLLKMGREYEPSGNVRSLSVFYAIPLRGTKEDWLNTQLKVWDEFTREPNRFIDVPGEHYTLMGPEHVAEFQAILRAELDRALSGN
jgi:acyl-CoA synthetase (AMP-forming)/AMP-acid ligase II/thioesterase domain-containing protein